MSCTLLSTQNHVGLLMKYIQKTLPLYETVVNENKWADVSGNGRVEINFNNVLMLFASYALTTGQVLPPLSP